METKKPSNSSQMLDWTKFTFILILFASISLVSCGKSDIEIRIENTTGADLKGVEISNDKGETTTGVFELRHGEAIRKQLSFSTVSPTDGHYILKVKDQDPREFGYYSNGSPLENQINIELRIDTVLIKME